MSGYVLLRFVVLSLTLVVIFIACSSPPNPNVGHPPDRYLSLDQYLSVSESRPGPGEIIPIELIDGKLSVLKNRYRGYARQAEDVACAGLIFQLATGSAGALTDHRLASISHDPELVRRVTRVRAWLVKNDISLDGLVLLICSMDKISNDQLSMLASTDVSSLMLNGLAYLKPEQAQILAGFSGQSISLDGLLWLGVEQAESFAEFSGDYLSLNQIRQLNRYTVEALCQFDGLQLHMNSLDSSSLGDFAQCLAERNVTLISDSE